MIQWRKIISFDFHHIPKLSIGFNIIILNIIIIIVTIIIIIVQILWT